MKRKHQRTLELIFARPTSGNVQWRDVEALFGELGAEVTEREGSRLAVFLLKKFGCSIGPSVSEHRQGCGSKHPQVV